MSLSVVTFIIVIDQGWIQAVVRFLVGLIGRIFVPT